MPPDSAPDSVTVLALLTRPPAVPSVMALASVTSLPVTSSVLPLFSVSVPVLMLLSSVMLRVPPLLTVVVPV
ncbi:hypothetical protein D3C80_683310 [compost metagenome]